MSNGLGFLIGYELFDTFDEVWASLTEEERQRVRDKARWEHVSLRAVLRDWPELFGVIPSPAKGTGT